MHHVKHRTEGEEDDETPNSVSSDRMKPRTKDNSANSGAYGTQQNQYRS